MPRETVAESRRGLGENIEAVIGELGGSGEPGADRAAFARVLFARGASEDLARYDAPGLARLAESAFDHLAEREPGRPSIRVYNPEAGKNAEASELSRVSIVEIVNDNMPFLLDSVMAELVERGSDIRLVLHPIVLTERGPGGRLVAYHGERSGEAADGALVESIIHVHLDRIEDETERREIEEGLAIVLAEVRDAVGDWKAMLARLDQTIEGFKANPPPIPVDELGEAIQFLEWLRDDNFTFIGMREYRFSGGKGPRLSRVLHSGLGILSDSEVKVLRRGREMVTVTPEILQFLREKEPLIITKANVRSRVHRRVHMDYIGVKTFNAKGDLAGELRIVGLFTSSAYTRSTRSIPMLRRKVANVVARAGFDPASHSGKSLLNVLETYPRDELFQLGEDTLYRFAIAILQLDERPRVRVLARPDRFDRFVSVIVFVPRDRFATEIRMRIGEYLARAFQGRVSAAYPDVSAGALARVHFIIGRYEGETPKPDQAELEAGIGELVTTWADRLRRALAERYEPAQARRLATHYAAAFDPGYRDTFAADHAVDDIARIERLSPSRPIAIDFQQRPDLPASRIGLKLYHRGLPVPLSRRVPILENMGFRAVDERTFRISPAESEEDCVWLHDTVLERADGEPVDLKSLDQRLEACFMAVWQGRAENDGYNALVLNAGLAWRDVAMLRGLSRYLRQVRVPFSQDYMWETLNEHGAIAASIATLFHARLDPSAADAEKAGTILAGIEEALDGVSSLDEDRILRRFVNVVECCLRTNFFQLGPDGAPHSTFAFKLDSRRLEEMPAPRPFVEIFVYGPAVEGVHLRFGKVARGGIRWSDRPQDFRTEVLGLVKAQQVKNAVIVPVGAKGGFVPKTLPEDSSREAYMRNGVAAYETFIGALLDVTDNLDGDQVVPPEAVMRRDEDDPYLVVAADKGTATFSDIANGIAEARGLWLGDAFASGGSAGYDHKKMGITARGGWEAVKRHFREFNVDIQTTPFTVAGVGDMSGDVFGNGMLLSRAIKLVAAFDHRDIFIDPAPNPEKSFGERKRLFEMPRSSWQDYDKRLISKGGGIFSRREKAVRLTAEMKALLNLDKASATPAEIIRAILGAEIDLLWFGGIGTYVRGPAESDESIGDRANDSVRIEAGALRARVVGEGANLGMSQRARIAYALAGGRVNTDAIDNSGGVNSSDLEVNIKIALAPEEQAGKLKRPARNRLLAAMGEEVAGLVLRNNYQQTLALSLAERRGVEDLGFARRLCQVLERRGLLDRQVEELPDDAALAERAKRGEALTRPELAVLLAYAKIALFDDLLESDVPDDEYLSNELKRYFPEKLKARHGGAIEAHRLRREIIATLLANSMINRGGPTLIVRLADQTGSDAARIAAAFAAVRDSFSMVALNGEIDALDGKIDGGLQLQLYGEVQALLLSQVVWFLRRAPLDEGLSHLVAHYRKGIDAFARALDKALPEALAEEREARAAELSEAGVPDVLSRRMADLPHLALAPDVIRVADEARTPLTRTAETFFAVGDRFSLDRIVQAARQCPVEDYYDRLAMDRIGERLETVQRRLTAEALSNGKGKAGSIDDWIDKRRRVVERTRAMVLEIADDPTPSVAKLAVATSLLGDMVDL